MVALYRYLYTDYNIRSSSLSRTIKTQESVLLNNSPYLPVSLSEIANTMTWNTSIINSCGYEVDVYIISGDQIPQLTSCQVNGQKLSPNQATSLVGVHNIIITVPNTGTIQLTEPAMDNFQRMCWAIISFLSWTGSCIGPRNNVSRALLNFPSPRVCIKYVGRQSYQWQVLALLGLRRWSYASTDPQPRYELHYPTQLRCPLGRDSHQ